MSLMSLMSQQLMCRAQVTGSPGTGSAGSRGTTLLIAAERECSLGGKRNQAQTGCADLTVAGVSSSVC
jgi:hypothetical protein